MITALLPLLLPSAALPTQEAGAVPAPVRHVIHVSVDGLSGRLLEERLDDDPEGLYSNFRRLVDEGASTLNARTDWFMTITLPNHTCMLTGRPVLKPKAQAETVPHGWVVNIDPKPGETLHSGGNRNVPYIASTFDVVHDHGMSTGLFAGKSKFVLYERSWDAQHGAPDTTGEDDGRDKIDVYVNRADIQGAFLTAMEEQRFNYAFLHYLDPDAAGHGFGWGGEAWDKAVQNVDDRIGEILDLVEGDPELAGSTVVIVSADHGGIDKGHSVSSVAINYTIPFFVWGAGVARGRDLYELNVGHRVDPLDARPTYDSTDVPIRNGDGGNLALALLGLPAVPGSTINVAQDLVVAGGEAARPTESGSPAPQRER